MNLFKVIDNLNLVKKIILIPILIIALCLIGYLMLVLAYCIPTDLMQKNMQNSTVVLSSEDTFPRLTNLKNSQLDNFTDSLMLLTASHPNTENVWPSAINARRYRVKGENSHGSLVLMSQQDNLDNLSIEEPSYTRYWHGYLLFLKPLLLLCSYSTIRCIVMFVQLGLFTLIILQLSKRNPKLLFPTFLTWIFLNPVTTMLSLQFNTVLTISFLAMLFILYFNEKFKQYSIYIWWLLFLIIGAITSYIDLLTYPLVTLGLPLILWLSLNYSNNIIENIKKVIIISFFWTIGFSCMWASKWILGTIITGNNVIESAVRQMGNRTSSVVNGQSFTFAQIIVENIKSSYHAVWLIALLFLFIIFLIKLIKHKKISTNILIPFAIISLYPFAWYFLLKNHSTIHSFFTYRELAISIYAISSFLMLNNTDKNNQ